MIWRGRRRKERDLEKENLPRGFTPSEAVDHEMDEHIPLSSNGEKLTVVFEVGVSFNSMKTLFIKLVEWANIKITLQVIVLIIFFFNQICQINWSNSSSNFSYSFSSSTNRITRISSSPTISNPSSSSFRGLKRWRRGNKASSPRDPVAVCVRSR